MLATAHPANPAQVDPPKTLLVMDDDWATPDAIQYAPEPLLIQNTKRFVLFPIQYPKFWSSYKQCEARFWSAEDIELAKDLSDLKAISGKERSLVLHVMVYLSSIRQWLNEASVISGVSTEIQCPEARCFYGFQLMQANIHDELFMAFLEHASLSQVERDDCFKFAHDLPSVSMKKAFVERWMDRQEHFSVRVAAFSVYLMMFQTAVTDLMLHFSKSGRFTGIIHALAKMNKDYSKYFQFSTLLSATLVNKPSTTMIQSMVAQAMSIEQQMATDFITLAGGAVSLGGEKVDGLLVRKHVQWMGEQTLSAMGYPTPGKKIPANPLAWVAAVIKAETDQEEKEHGSAATEKSHTQNVMNIEQAFSISDDF